MKNKRTSRDYFGFLRRLIREQIEEYNVLCTCVSFFECRIYLHVCTETWQEWYSVSKPLFCKGSVQVQTSTRRRLAKNPR